MNAEPAPLPPHILIDQPMAVLAVLMGLLALLFAVRSQPWGDRLFKIVPLLIFAYFVPAALTNIPFPVGDTRGVYILPRDSEIYDFAKTWLLPASLILLTMSVDIPAILRLGPTVLILFLTATATIVLGGPLALLIYNFGLGPLLQMLEAPLASLTGWSFQFAMPEDGWRGLAALSGSWIGGGANFLAIGASAEASGSLIGLMVVIDVAIANIWMAALLFFAGRERALDEGIGADRSRIDEVRRRVEGFQKDVARPTSLPDLLTILVLAVGGTVVATRLGTELEAWLPGLASILNAFTWTVVLVTTLGLAISFTPLRKLDGAGAGAIGSVFLYLLVTTIGAHAEFDRVLEAPSLSIVAAIWMAFHAGTLLLVRRWLKAPIFFLAVGSKANVGGAASAPILAAAFHPALAPVGVLLAVAGYVLGTYAGLVCRTLLELVAKLG